ncbi:MAG: Fic family protein [Gammaproteobacteria bacterium]|nr:Fic family protein [Gammaproteobacteria bacterium]MBU1732464.1 Fic family protein [Gammaproteobacteria bacterium]MBU1894034.1 Fic family protein [Gammaproteobacteria bacterium]
MKRSDLSPAHQKRLVPVPDRSGAFALIPPPTPAMVPLTGIEHEVLKAHEALGRVRQLISDLPNPDLIARTLDRREAVKSSQIEGTHAEVDELFEYEATGDDEGLHGDVRVTLNYVKALDVGLQAVRQVGTLAITKSLIQDLHRILMEGVKEYRDVPGELRAIQNWIGSGNIYDASLVPPPPNQVSPCLDDLMSLLQYQADGVAVVSIVVRLAIVHAQFEAIHPFRDGNGRVGRLLLPIMLAAEDYPPVYLAGYLKSNQRSYYDTLLAAQTRGEWQVWVRFLARGIVESCNEAAEMTRRLQGLRDEWRMRVSSLRGDATGRKLIEILIGSPIVTANSVKEQLGVSFPAANTAIAQLVELGILQASERRRNRIFVAGQVVALLRRGVDSAGDGAQRARL